MPITKSEQKYWDRLRHILKRRLLHLCGSELKAKYKDNNFNMITHELTQAAIDLNSEDDTLFYVAFRAMMRQIFVQKMNAEERQDALNYFMSVPEIEEALALLKTEIVNIIEKSIASPENTPPKPNELPFSTANLQDTMYDWIQERYCFVDERILSTEERIVRRMDSLARLLALSTRLSVCTAVTLDLSNPDKPTIAIAANVSEPNTQKEIYTNLQNRLNAIKQFMAEITQLKLSKAEAMQSLDSLAAKLTKNLYQCVAFSAPESLVIQAAKKMIHAVCFDDETLGEVEKRAFLPEARARIILPVGNQASFYSMNVRTLEQNVVKDESYHLTNVKPDTNLNFIHAEQLLAYYHFKEAAIKPKSLIIGLNKLCCCTCYDNLCTYSDSIIVRGNHNQRYQGVVDIATGEVVPELPPKRAITHAENSPFTSPESKKTSKLHGGPFTKSYGQTLFKPSSNNDDDVLTKSPDLPPNQ